MFLLPPFLGATPSLTSIRANSSRSMVPSALESYSSNIFFTVSRSTLLSRISVRTGLTSAGAAATPGTFPVAMCSATASMNCSVVSPDGPHRSRVPAPATMHACMESRSPLDQSISFCASGQVPASMPSFAECWMAPIMASARPSGLSEVSSPRRCMCHRSATVPWDASYSLIMVPSAFCPIRLEVMNPGLRCTCATSSVSMSPS
mmetsp:Transcript_8475/g.20404  ORF Transcript_8475/g.20404 Transcript_8475/m.20404 type:complete len:205 (-) Transcript_8475:1184-1798(-)